MTLSGCCPTVQVLPEGQFITEIGNDQFEGVIRQISGEPAVAEWRHLQEVMRPLAKAATTLPPAAIRLDPGTQALSCSAMLASASGFRVLNILHLWQVSSPFASSWQACRQITFTNAFQVPSPLAYHAGAALTVGIRYAPQFLGGGWQSFQLLKPFSEVSRQTLRHSISSLLHQHHSC